ncbi:molecular chaperone HtpG [bacterium]|nr:molecular chaperone HtpG [bacterium]
MAKKTHNFQAEVEQILDLMVHSLYSQKEIFLRELVSNSSDALEKRRIEGVKDEAIRSDDEAHIRLAFDKEARTITISDNGIGMTAEEVDQNIGTIAHSGTKAFFENAKKVKENPELIGQFGVGFYSAFMVADKVTLHTQKAGSTAGLIWESTGNGSYSTEDAVRTEGAGTTITLHMKKDETEGAQDFLDEWAIRGIITKYSDFIEFPIKMLCTRQEPELDAEGKPVEGKTITKEVDETVNTQKALWRRSASEVTDEEYSAFYKQTCKDWTDPMDTIHYRAEGLQEFTSLLFIPSQLPFDYNQREAKWGPSLYVKKVFISDSVEDLLPIYLRFVKGIVDSDDLPLNVSREILQKDHRIKAIGKALIFKVLKQFENTLRKDREAYEKFWGLWGSTLKEGIASDHANKEKIQKISLFKTSLDDRLTTLDEYVARMKEDQKSIYFLTGETIDQIKSSPYLEKLRKKDYEVLFLTDPIDEWVMQHITTFADKPVENITRADLELDTEEEKKEREETLKGKEEELAPLTKTIQSTLDEKIQEVKLSSRLVDSPVCLVSGAHDPSARMERIMESMGQAAPKAKRILEINPEHPVIERMASQSSDVQAKWAEILYNQALLNEGSPIADPAGFTKQISDLMVNAAR